MAAVDLKTGGTCMTAANLDPLLVTPILLLQVLTQLVTTPWGFLLNQINYAAPTNPVWSVPGQIQSFKWVSGT